VVATLLKEADRIRAELGDYGQIGSDQRALWPPYNSKPNKPENKSRSTPQSPEKKSRPTAAPKTDATPSERSASFDFESGKLEPWKVIEGSFAHPVGNRVEFFNSSEEVNKQGTYYLTTLETDEKGAHTDKQTGVIVSPLFIPKGGNMTFRIGSRRGWRLYLPVKTVPFEESVTNVESSNGTIHSRI